MAKKKFVTRLTLRLRRLHGVHGKIQQVANSRLSVRAATIYCARSSRTGGDLRPAHPPTRKTQQYDLTSHSGAGDKLDNINEYIRVFTRRAGRGARASPCNMRYACWRARSVCAAGRRRRFFFSSPLVASSRASASESPPGAA